MEEQILGLTNVKAEEDAELYTATFPNEKTRHSIHPKSPWWKHIQAHLDAEKYVKPYVPHVDTPEELMAASDRKIVAMSARCIEDFVDDRVANGKDVSQDLIDISAERKVLREPLTAKANMKE